ncbi:hypothetical protein [Lysobacter gummosus]|uniref:hypothetical protein n=1 Tax=Lysobacter gummosus TaxID=262324 RepID=UPI003638778E
MVVGVAWSDRKASGLKPLPQKIVSPRSLLWEGLQPRCLSIRRDNPTKTKTGQWPVFAFIGWLPATGRFKRPSPHQPDSAAYERPYTSSRRTISSSPR